MGFPKMCLSSPFFNAGSVVITGYCHNTMHQATRHTRGTPLHTVPQCKVVVLPQVPGSYRGPGAKCNSNTASQETFGNVHFLCSLLRHVVFTSKGNKNQRRRPGPFALHPNLPHPVALAPNGDMCFALPSQGTQGGYVAQAPYVALCGGVAWWAWLLFVSALPPFRYERGYTVVVEKTEVLALLDELAQAILTTAPCSAALLPSATPLLQDCVAEDQALISAVFRMNRSLTHMIQDGAAVGGFPGNNWRNVIPLKRMAASLASGLVPIKRATLTQPGVDVYMYAMLTQERKDIMKAVIVSVSQIILMATLSLGIDISSFGAEFHSIVFSVIISFVVVFAVTRQVEQHQICRKVFGFSYWPGNGVPFCITLMAWLDFLANVVFAWMLFVMSFLLLMCTTEYLELALNSTATLFILEVDEMVINVEIDELHGLYLQRCFETVTNIVMEVTDFRYWQGWKRLQHDKTCRINRKHCALVWPRQD